YPGRFIPLSIPPVWDPQLMADEVHRVAKKGCHAVTFSEDPSAPGWPAILGDHWDPFFAACQDEGMVICLHIGPSSTMPGPSQVARDHFTFCFISDRAGVEDRHAIGIGNITWECDYPHSDSSWPHSPESVIKQLDGVPDHEINKITHENARRIFRYDPFATIP